MLAVAGLAADWQQIIRGGRAERMFEKKSNLRSRNSQTLVRGFLERTFEEISNVGLRFTGMGGWGKHRFT